MTTFNTGYGPWVQYRALNPVEIDFHYGSQRHLPYHEREAFETRMERVRGEALDALKGAQASGANWVLFTHGESTSGPGKQSARSVVRGLMRSPEATPYIARRECIQHETVFVAKIRPTGR